MRASVRCVKENARGFARLFRSLWHSVDSCVSVAVAGCQCGTRELGGVEREARVTVSLPMLRVSRVSGSQCARYSAPTKKLGKDLLHF